MGQVNDELYRRVAKVSRTKRIMVVTWALGKGRGADGYVGTMTDCLRRSGFREIITLDREWSRAEAERQLRKVDVVYFFGGDSDWLYDEIKKRGLDEPLRRFKGILAGDSAGAIAISKGEYYDGELCRGLGLADVYINVHFEMGSRHFSIDKKRERPVIYIPEGSWVAVKP